MEDVIVYIDNIILFTKRSFDYQVQRIYTLVLQLFQQNNLA
jgi:hypothetical protein